MPTFRSLVWSLVVALIVPFTLPAVVAAAEGDSPAVELFERNSLAGWNYGIADFTGWSVRDGVLIAKSPINPVIAGWTFGDFELSCKWTSTGGPWNLDLLPVGNVDVSHRINFQNDSGQEQSFHLSRRGKLLRWKIGDTVNGEQSIAPDLRVGLQLAFGGTEGTMRELRVSEPAGRALFNGKDTTGWWTPGKLESWPVIDGNLVCINQNGNYLRSEELFGNFTLSLEYKIAAGGNSGVGIRTPREGWPSGDGMELQIMDEKAGTPLTRHSTMAIYGNLEPLGKADKSGEWNQAVIKTEGYMVSAWINGRLVQQTNTAHLPELKHRNLKGWIGFQDHGARTEFRNINVLTAPEGLGLSVWKGSTRRTGSQLIAERYMNTESLAREDGIRSHNMIAAAGGEGEDVVAELTGPGAIVELFRGNETGRVAVYLDGDTKPVIDCEAKKLAEHLPLVSEDRRSPLLTYLPFRKSLKLTVRDAQLSLYRIDYVTFDDRVQVEKYDGPDSTMSRGLLPSLSYRYQQGSWGGHRELDPQPRKTSDAVTLEPGKSQSLIKLDGLGVVRWVKLHYPANQLVNDDLWLVAHVDGETTPAIEVPARYWFPGLSEGKKYHNFLVTDKGGQTNYLAMPYGKGISIGLENRGEEPIKNVRLGVSYEPLDSSSDVADLPDHRLRARLTPSDLGNTRPVRIVGIVCQADERLDIMVNDAVKLRSILGLGAKATNETHGLCGIRGGLAWRWFLPAPIEMTPKSSLPLSQLAVIYYAPIK